MRRGASTLQPPEYEAISESPVTDSGSDSDPRLRPIRYIEAMAQPLVALVASVKETPNFDPAIALQRWDQVEAVRQRSSTDLIYRFAEMSPPGTPVPWNQEQEPQRTDEGSL